MEKLEEKTRHQKTTLRLGKIFIQNQKKNLEVVIYTYNPIRQEAEAEGLQ